MQPKAPACSRGAFAQQPYDSFVAVSGIPIVVHCFHLFTIFKAGIFNPDYQRDNHLRLTL
jgi:hypothetical protein